MNLFNNLIRDQGWIDVQLKNRSFTWTNKRPSPTLSKIDQIFISSEWQSMFPLISLQALSMVVSDHVPLLLTFRHHHTKPRTRRLENYWFQYSEAHQIIQTIWEQPSGEIADFQQKIDSLHCKLGEWHANQFTQMDSQLDACHKAILLFDQIEEKRNLDAREFNLRQRIRERAYELARNTELRWKQRARILWLKNGDRNTRYFHVMESARHNRNMIKTVTHEGEAVTGEKEIARVFLEHMKGLLGMQSQVLMLRWWWKIYCEPDSLRTVVITMLKGKGNVAHGPKFFIKWGCSFWGQLSKIRGIFNWSCYWEIGDGSSISFWFDNWDPDTHDRITAGRAKGAKTKYFIEGCHPSSSLHRP